MFAAAPLLFAAQQAAEGVVWLTINDPAAAWQQQLAVDVFLGFALIVWPLWLPVSLQRMERNPQRRRVLLGLVAIGAVVSIYAAVLLARWHPLAETAGHSIRYLYKAGPEALSPSFYVAAYAVPTVLPFFVSSAALARVIGMALIVSLIAAAIVERDALTSVWCFFAAVLSVLVLVAIVRERRSAHGE
jgi:hypothetical protein